MTWAFRKVRRRYMGIAWVWHGVKEGGGYVHEEEQDMQRWSRRCAEQNSAGSLQLSWPIQFTNVLRQASQSNISHLWDGKSFWLETKIDGWLKHCIDFAYGGKLLKENSLCKSIKIKYCTSFGFYCIQIFLFVSGHRISNKIMVNRISGHFIQQNIEWNTNLFLWWKKTIMIKAKALPKGDQY